MLEENPDDAAAGGKDIIDPAEPATLLPEEDDITDKDADSTGERGLDNIGADGDATDEDDRRKYPRSEFTYPVEFKVFSQHHDNTSFNGYLRDISVNGACLQYEDRYGRFLLKDMNGAKIKISLSIPHGDKVSIFARAKWVKKDDCGSFLFKIAIEFEDIAAWQAGIVKKLISMRNKDHNMMWNLWAQYENNR